MRHSTLELDVATISREMGRLATALSWCEVNHPQPNEHFDWARTVSFLQVRMPENSGSEERKQARTYSKKGENGCYVGERRRRRKHFLLLSHWV